MVLSHLARLVYSTPQTVSLWATVPVVASNWSLIFLLHFSHARRSDGRRRHLSVRWSRQRAWVRCSTRWRQPFLSQLRLDMDLLDLIDGLLEDVSVGLGPLIERQDGEADLLDDVFIDGKQLKPRRVVRERQLQTPNKTDMNDHLTKAWGYFMLCFVHTTVPWGCTSLPH